MNRVIKFRGKRTDDGKWIYGYLADEDYINNINEVAMPSEEVDSNTIGQFTGLRDRNGNEIFEGDIVLLDFNTRSVKELVVFKNGRFVTFDPEHPYREDSLSLFIDCATVIGNIIDNPQELKQ